ncbi:MAG: hypothetical protein IJD38_13060 [Clostridia bacterium]|nr:hypothetical protein [Clostridia bacterium]
MATLEHEALVRGEANLQTLNAEQKEYLCASLFIRIRELYRQQNPTAISKETEEATK